MSFSQEDLLKIDLQNEFDAATAASQQCDDEVGDVLGGPSHSDDGVLHMNELYNSLLAVVDEADRVAGVGSGWSPVGGHPTLVPGDATTWPVVTSDSDDWNVQGEPKHDHF